MGMTDMKNFWKNKRVFVTGHTGFKGSWLSLLLTSWGAEVSGYSFEPSTEPALFELAKLKELMVSNIGDVRDYQRLLECMSVAEPEIIIHMAAQPIVLDSYTRPLETFAINVMGTANVMEAARCCASLKALVNVTTDKCYENENGSKRTFKEDDKLGGHDPYSASKACSELVTASFCKSFFYGDATAAVATARAGNVIGGSDWAPNRLLPDFFRAIAENKVFLIRNPDAVRPWQHVMDALNAYLVIAEALYFRGHDISGSWNVGPDPDDFFTVRHLVEKITQLWPSVVKYEMPEADDKPHEASFLALDNSKIKEKLSWHPHWNTDRAIEETVSWFREYFDGRNAREITLAQIDKFYQENT